MEDNDKEIKLQVRLALLERSNKMLAWALGPIGTIAIIAGTYAWNSQSSIVRLDTQVMQVTKAKDDIIKALNETNVDLGSVQTWVEENYVSKEVFEATKKID